MSPRPVRLRKISNPPAISGLKPYGHNPVEKAPEVVYLQYEEYEALRLCDYEMLNHNKASLNMDVSRPTLTRIYAHARQKIAEALVLGKQIIIEGGKIYFDSDWYTCFSCGCYFNNPEKEKMIVECPLCKSIDFANYKQNTGEFEESHISFNDICICPECGFEQPHQSGRPCNEEICPECTKNMIRKRKSQNRNS